MTEMRDEILSKLPGVVFYNYSKQKHAPEEGLGEVTMVRHPTNQNPPLVLAIVNGVKDWYTLGDDGLLRMIYLSQIHQAPAYSNDAWRTLEQALQIECLEAGIPYKK
ncbi:hypothetical protein BXG10_24000 [Salmonella enterica subsp. enterica serovar Enteritidis]|nr:hypothetical protein [Salmonella enterica subsp. enterica serovar Enteritidis]